MKLEKQVNSLELGIKLQGMGVNEDSFWSWFNTTDRDDTPRLNRTNENCPVCCLPKQTFEAKYPAFTVAELGDMLPDLCETYRYKGEYNCQFFKKEDGKDKLVYSLWADTEANAKARMLVYLLENEIVTCNKPAK